MTFIVILRVALIIESLYNRMHKPEMIDYLSFIIYADYFEIKELFV